MHAAAIPDELVELSAELEALGGGDTRVGEATVFCRVRPVERASEAPIVTVGSSGSHMLVRDPRTSDTTPAAHAVRRFRISPGGAIGGAAALAAPVGRGATQSDVAASVGREALEWWLAGFNASVIAHGQTGAGKTYSLYGPAAAVYAESVPPDAMGLVPRLLGRVYEAIEAAATSEDGAPRLSLGVSCFEVRHASVVDLLAPEQRGGGGGGGGGGGCAADDFVAVSAPELSDALSLLATAQRRSANWSVAPGGAGGRPMLVATAGRASVVPRLTLVRDV
uniref:Kinesin motor domain-containing protein n=1 Tax=Emiliania huxleyi TaxID=2903 RepID=A0A7S3T2C8_EMIHU